MGSDEENGISPGSLPGQGYKAVNRASTSTREGWEVVLPIPGGSTEGGGRSEDQDVDPRRQNTVAQFIATRPILGLCEVTERRPGTQVPRRLWEQTGIYWKASRKAAEAKNGEDEVMAEEPELTGSDSEPETTA